MLRPSTLLCNETNSAGQRQTQHWRHEPSSADSTARPSFTLASYLVGQADETLRVVPLLCAASPSDCGSRRGLDASFNGLPPHTRA